MSNPFSDLLELEDYELVMEVCDYIVDDIRRCAASGCAEDIPLEKFFIVAVGNYDMEMQNGGLCQFFMNVGKAYAPILPDALNAIGASVHSELFLRFCDKHHIDRTDLKGFDCVDIDLYLKMLSKYPFEEFDQAYYDLDRENSLCALAAAYIRQHFGTLFPS